MCFFTATTCAKKDILLQNVVDKSFLCLWCSPHLKMSVQLSEPPHVASIHTRTEQAWNKRKSWKHHIEQIVACNDIYGKFYQEESQISLFNHGNFYLVLIFVQRLRSKPWTYKSIVFSFSFCLSSCIQFSRPLIGQKHTFPQGQTTPQPNEIVQL